MSKLLKELKQQIVYLENKLAECEKGNDEWVKICDGKLETINRLIEEKHELQQQLAEKEKERHEEWLNAKEWKWECDRLKKQLHTANQETLHFQNKYFAENQTAIEELNNILDTFAIFVNEEKESMVSPDESGNLSLLEYIEKRIDILKGEHKC